MPCKTEDPKAEMLRDRENVRRGVEERTRIEEAEAEAKRLLTWLETVNKKDNTANLCERIRAMGDDDFIKIVSARLDQPEARKILGWWEDHKEHDKAAGR